MRQYTHPRTEIISVLITPPILSTSGDPTPTVKGGDNQVKAW